MEYCKQQHGKLICTHMSTCWMLSPGGKPVQASERDTRRLDRETHNCRSPFHGLFCFLVVSLRDEERWPREIKLGFNHTASKTRSISLAPTPTLHCTYLKFLVTGQGWVFCRGGRRDLHTPGLWTQARPQPSKPKLYDSTLYSLPSGATCSKNATQLRPLGWAEGSDGRDSEILQSRIHILQKLT